MTIPLVILATLAVCIALLAVAWAAGAKLPGPVFGLAALTILVVAAATLVRIVVHDVAGR